MRGGRGGGRGGTPIAKRSYNADYTNVGFDYDAINKQGYRRMEGELMRHCSRSSLRGRADVSRL